MHSQLRDPPYIHTIHSPLIYLRLHSPFIYTLSNPFHPILLVHTLTSTLSHIYSRHQTHFPQKCLLVPTSLIWHFTLSYYVQSSSIAWVVFWAPGKCRPRFEALWTFNERAPQPNFTGDDCAKNLTGDGVAPSLQKTNIERIIYIECLLRQCANHLCACARVYKMYFLWVYPMTQ